MVNIEQFEQMIRSVFAPKKDEHILLLNDIPTINFRDNIEWKKRRKLVDQWFTLLLDLKKKYYFSCEKKEYKATGAHNNHLDEKTISWCKNANIIIAMNEFSATSTLVNLVRKHSDILRCASMPLAEERMMDTVFSMDYTDVKKYAHRLKILLDEAISATVLFNTDKMLFIDLRNRLGGADDGDCRRPGSFINFPSGEGFIAPYEGTNIEKNEFGKSKTKGILPIFYKNEILNAVVNENRIVDVEGSSRFVEELKLFFSGFDQRNNIAELGIGCNPQARVTGNFIEDEKVGVHIAYGTSSHLGGRITSDIHTDIVYVKGCKVYAEQVILHYKQKDDLLIVKDGNLCYDYL